MSLTANILTLGRRRQRHCLPETAEFGLAERDRMTTPGCTTSTSGDNAVWWDTIHHVAVRLKSAYVGGAAGVMAVWRNTCFPLRARRSGPHQYLHISPTQKYVLSPFEKAAYFPKAHHSALAVLMRYTVACSAFRYYRLGNAEVKRS